MGAKYDVKQRRLSKKARNTDADFYFLRGGGAEIRKFRKLPTMNIICNYIV